MFVVLGLWTPWALRGLLILVTIFMGGVGQAIIRNLPIKDCGCFGEGFSFPLPVTLLFDGVLWIYIAFLMIRLERTIHFSVDQYYLREKK